MVGVETEPAGEAGDFPEVVDWTCLHGDGLADTGLTEEDEVEDGRHRKEERVVRLEAKVVLVIVVVGVVVRNRTVVGLLAQRGPPERE